jgi:hypothetical protein
MQNREPRRKDMDKPVSIDQSHNLISVLANNVNWEALDGDMIQRIINNPQKAGADFTAFLKNAARLQTSLPRVIKIDRAKPFNPAEFIGMGWSIAEEDDRSLELSEVDLSSVRFEQMLETEETWVKGEEKLRRLKEARPVRIDAKVFQTLWENQHLIAESWKDEANDKTTFIFFDGTVLQCPDGHRYVLCLYWYSGQWYWSPRCLELDWNALSPSAILAG